MAMARHFIASRRGLLPAGGHIRLCFHAELNTHLAPALCGRAFEHVLAGRASVKDVIESLGVPHTEVDLVLVDEHSVGFDTLLEHGADVAVYPRSAAPPLRRLRHLQPRLRRVRRFVLDGHLARLARGLRVLGFDVACTPSWTDEQLVQCAADEYRMLLTRDRGLLKRCAVRRGAYVYASDPRQQLLEVVARFDLRRALRPFSRCPRCGGRLLRATKRSLAGRLDAALLARHAHFHRCRDCGQVYWPGTHHARLRKMVDAVRVAPPAGTR